MCPLCNVPVSMKHLIWQCKYHEDDLPVEWQQRIQANEDAMLWARGLIEVPAYRPVDGSDSCQVSGMFAQGWPVRVKARPTGLQLGSMLLAKILASKSLL